VRLSPGEPSHATEEAVIRWQRMPCVSTRVRARSSLVSSRWARRTCQYLYLNLPLPHAFDQHRRPPYTELLHTELLPKTSCPHHETVQTTQCTGRLRIYES